MTYEYDQGCIKENSTLPSPVGGGGKMVVHAQSKKSKNVNAKGKVFILIDNTMGKMFFHGRSLENTFMVHLNYFWAQILVLKDCKNMW